MSPVLRGVVFAGAAALIVGCGGGGGGKVGKGVAGAGGDPRSAAARYTSPDGNYRVAFPGTPKTAEQKIPSPIGEQTLHTATIDKGRATWMVAWSQYPERVLRERPAEAPLDGGIRGMSSAGNWTVVGQGPFQLGPHPGREVKFRANSADGGTPGRGLARVLLVGDRFYQVLMIGPEDTTMPEDLEGFVRSFETVKDVPVIASRQPVAAPPGMSSPAGGAPQPARPQPAPVREPGPLVRSAGGASVVDFRFVDGDEDKVGTDGPEAGRPNGRKDLHFRADLDLPPGTTIDELIVSSGGSHRWVTRPNDRYWLLGVEQDGKAVIPGYSDRVGDFSAARGFDLFGQGDLGPGTPFELRASLTIDGKPVEIGASCTRPKPDSKPGAIATGSTSGGAILASLQWVDDADDRVGTNGPDAGQPNGEKDQHLRVEVDLPERTTIRDVVVAVRDTNHRWESKPGDRYWAVAVYRGDNPISKAQVAEVGTFSGKQVFDLYANGGLGLQPGAKFDVEMELAIGGEAHTIKGTCGRP